MASRRQFQRLLILTVFLAACLIAVLLGLPLRSNGLEMGVPIAQAQGGPTTTPVASLVPILPSGGADYLLMIDQSLSMWQDHQGSPPNDPDNKRISAAQALVSQIGNDVLWFDQRRINRLVVLSFAEAITRELNVTEIKPTNSVEWDDKQAPAIKAQIQPKRMTGGTDFEDIFVAARQLFTGPMSIPPAANQGPRERVMLLVTDGCPYVEKNGGGLNFIPEEGWAASPEKDQYPNWNAYYKKWLDGYMADRTAFFREQFGKNYYLFLIAVNDGSDDYWSRCGAPWETMVKAAHDGSQIWKHVLPEDLAGIMLEISQTVFPTHLEEFRGSVQPYLDKIILTAVKKRADSNVFIYRQSNNANSLVKVGDADVIGHNKSDVMEQWVIHRPLPGTWSRVGETSESVDVKQERIPITASVQSLPAQPLGSTVSITYELHEVDGALFTEDSRYDPQYIATAQATVIAPDGKPVTPAPSVGRTSPGIYVLTGLKLNQVGEYGITVVGTAKLPPEQNGNSSPGMREVFREDRGRVQVYRVTLYDSKIESPKPDQSLPLHGDLLSLFAVQPAAVQLRLHDSNGQPINPETAIEGGGTDAFEATLTGPDGKTETAKLQYDSVRGLFTAPIGRKLESEGKYSLSVAFVGANTREYRLNSTEAAVAFQRTDGFLNRPWPYAGALVGMLAILGFMVVQFRSRVLGRLVTSVPGTGSDMDDISVNALSPWKKLGKKDLDKYPSLTGVTTMCVSKLDRSDRDHWRVRVQAKYEDGSESDDQIEEDQLTTFQPGVAITYKRC